MSETIHQPGADERRQALASRVAGEVSAGGRVESQSDYQAVIVRGKRPNHLLHLILTLVTLGTWVLVWVPVAIFAGEKRHVLTVDNYGNVSRR